MILLVQEVNVMSTSVTLHWRFAVVWRFHYRASHETKCDRLSDHRKNLHRRRSLSPKLELKVVYISSNFSSSLVSTFNNRNFMHSVSLINANSFTLCPQGCFLSFFLMPRLTLFINILFSYKYALLGILSSVIQLT